MTTPQSTLFFRKRHPARVELRRLRQLTRALLHEELGRHAYDLGFYLVGDEEMIRVNETFLRHAGSTDVITFDYTEPGEPASLAGEIFICLDEARRQACRFHTSWQSELVRYVVHSLLHLSGYDDLRTAERRKMKREENRLVKALEGRCRFSGLGKW